MSGKDTINCAAEGGCTPVKEMHKELFEKDGLKDKLTTLYSIVKGKMSWVAAMRIIGSVIIGIIIAIFWGAIWLGDIRVMAENYPKVKEKLEANDIDHNTRLTKLETKQDTIESNTSEILRLLREDRQDKDAKKIASKQLQEYNKPETN